MKSGHTPLRVLFAGTPEFALPALQVLLAEGCDIVAVLTQPDRPAGRGKKLRASPVKQLALDRGLTVLQPTTLGSKPWQEKIVRLQPDLIVVVAYGLMIPAGLLSSSPLGCWNIHASLLPRWRGAAPIQRAIEAGDPETGVCIMQMQETLDTGPLYHCRKTPIGPDDTAGTLHDRLAQLGARALRFCLRAAISDQLGQAREQAGDQVIYASKLSKAEAQLDWLQPAQILERRVRAFNPWPVAWCELGSQRLRIWRAAVISPVVALEPGEVFNDGASLIIGTADKALNILELQKAGGKRMPVAEYLRAHHLQSIQ